MKELEELSGAGVKHSSKNALKMNPSVRQGAAQQYMLGLAAHVIELLRWGPVPLLRMLLQINVLILITEPLLHLVKRHMPFSG